MQPLWCMFLVGFLTSRLWSLWGKSFITTIHVSCRIRWEPREKPKRFVSPSELAKITPQEWAMVASRTTLLLMRQSAYQDNHTDEISLYWAKALVIQAATRAWSSASVLNGLVRKVVTSWSLTSEGTEVTWSVESWKFQPILTWNLDAAIRKILIETPCLFHP